MTKRKNASARVVVIGAVSLVTVGAFIAACGLDDSVIDESPGGSHSGSDATIGADGSTPFSDGAISVTDDDASDAAPDVPHILLDGADPTDADLSDATVADGGCASGEYACMFRGNTYCLGDCSPCNGLNYACDSTQSCVASCSDCSDKTECFRAGYFGHRNYCVQDGPSCASVSGNPVFCGPIASYYVDCPGSDQVCVNNQCLTCGESATIGSTCSPSSSEKCSSPGPTCH